VAQNWCRANWLLNPISLVAIPCCNRLVASRKSCSPAPWVRLLRRRDFIKLIAGTGATWPLAVYGQQSARPLVGFLHFGSSAPFEYQVAAFNQGLKETGYVDGQNAAIEYRWAEGQYNRLPALATDLVNRKTDVIAAIGPPAQAQQNKQPRRSQLSLRSAPIRLQ
jgi:hypothetical protein